MGSECGLTPLSGEQHLDEVRRLLRTYGVVNVRRLLRVFPPLLPVFLRGEVNSLQQQHRV